MLKKVALVAILARALAAAWMAYGVGTVGPDTMSWVYFEQGRQIAAGQGYLAPWRSDGSPEMLHPPGMALLVAGARLATGHDRFAMQVLAIALDTIAAVIVAWIVRTILASPKLGLIAGICYALWPPVVWSAASGGNPEGFQPLFVVGALASAVQVARTGRWRWVVSCGVATGAGAYLRPDYLLVAIPLALGVWSYTRSARRAASILVAQAVAFALLLPWAYRNHELCGRWIFTSTSVGATLITGLGEFDNPWGFGGLDEHRSREAAAGGLDSAWSSEADVFFRRLYWSAVKERPGAAVRAALKRLPVALAPPQGFGYSNPLRAAYSFTEARLQGIDKLALVRSRPLYVLAAYWDELLIAALNLAGLAGAMLLLRHRAGALLVMPHAYSVATHALTHVEARFLLPSSFVLSMGIAFLIWQLWEWRSRRRRDVDAERSDSSWTTGSEGASVPRN